MDFKERSLLKYSLHNMSFPVHQLKLISFFIKNDNFKMHRSINPCIYKTIMNHSVKVNQNGAGNCNKGTF